MTDNNNLDYHDPDAKLKMCISCENDFYGNTGRLLCKECYNALTQSAIDNKYLKHENETDKDFIERIKTEVNKND